MSDIRIQQIKVVETQVKPPVTKKEEEENPAVTPQAPAVNRKSADEVLGFMANSAPLTGTQGVDTRKTTTVKVSNYVTNEQAQRIGESVNVFFAGMEKHVEAAVKEFNITPAQAQALTAMRFNQKFDDDDTAIVASGQRLIIT
jgi:hypothetical protein